MLLAGCIVVAVLISIIYYTIRESKFKKGIENQMFDLEKKMDEQISDMRKTSKQMRDILK